MKIQSTIATCILSLLTTTAYGENGVSEKEITFGQTAALEGQTAELGKGMQIGIQAAFKEANAAGGVKGKQLSLKSMDDSYEPEKAIANTKKLINEDKVFALIGAVGTPTAKAIEPITSEAKVPFVGPFTGAGFLRAKDKKYVVNIRASYEQETALWIERLTKDKQAKKIGIVYQDDAFGQAGLDGVEKAMKKNNLELAAKGTYPRNTTDVKGAVISTKKGETDAVVIVGAYKPVAEFIKTAKKVDIKGPFVNISFVGSNALAKELGADGDGVVVTQVVPLPTDKSIKIVEQYQKALAAQDANEKPGFVSLEGYIVGRVAVEALKNVDGEVTRDSFIAALAKVKDIDGFKLDFGPEKNQGSDEVFVTKISGNEFKSIKSFAE